MIKKLILILTFFISFIVNGQKTELSNLAEISVLTIAPGPLLNDAFGHSAFRIKDPVNAIDLVFNYGVYDFETPNFYLKFAQGKLNYLIGVNYYEDFYTSYVNQNRTIKSQTLNLSETEKQELYSYLLENIKPENRAYLYDFFYDNCATRIRDVLQIASNEPIIYNNPPNLKEQTFRSLIHDHVDYNSWGALGIDIALGSVIDRNATAYEHMFLPEYIFEFFAEATFKDSQNEPVVKDTEILFEQLDKPNSKDFFLSPLFILGLLALGILLITYKDYKNKKRSKWLDVSIFIFTGLVGILILLLWFATDHTGTKYNYNLLWAFALNILFIGQLLREKEQISNWFRKYLKFLILLLCLLVLHWTIGVQVFALVLIPLLIALAVRYVYLIRFLKK